MVLKTSLRTIIHKTWSSFAQLVNASNVGYTRTRELRTCNDWVLRIVPGRTKPRWEVLVTVGAIMVF